MAVWFQSKADSKISSNDLQIVEINKNLSALARWEFFHFKRMERVRVYRIFDPKCAQRFEITNSDTIVLYIKAQTPEESNPPVISNDKLFNLPYLKRWISTAISDVQRTFNKRVAYSIMED